MRDAAFIFARLHSFLQHKDADWSSEYGSMLDIKQDAISPVFSVGRC